MLAKTKPSFDLIVRSSIVRGERPTDGLVAIPAPNPNLMNRIIGFLDDGQKVVVCQRPSKGGMDFTKIMGGKVYAVAADALSPVFEKGPDKQPTKTIKTEDGLPVYSSSGFYMMSSKEYPALEIKEYYTRLINKGQHVLLVSPAQLAAKQSHTLESEFDLELLTMTWQEALGDENNLVAKFDEDINKARKRSLQRAREDAEDANENFEGPEFAELAVSKKDGNPFIHLSWHDEAGHHFAGVMREGEEVNDDGKLVTVYYSPEEAITAFMNSRACKAILASLEAGKPVSLSWMQGHLMRTSVSFKRKVENLLKTPPEAPVYGDFVYIRGAMQTWCKGLVTLMHSHHPRFPKADYDALHYVAAPRQAEIGMNKLGDKYSPPAIIDCGDLFI